MLAPHPHDFHAVRAGGVIPFRQPRELALKEAAIKRDGGNELDATNRNMDVPAIKFCVGQVSDVNWKPHSHLSNPHAGCKRSELLSGSRRLAGHKSGIRHTPGSEVNCRRLTSAGLIPFARSASRIMRFSRAVPHGASVAGGVSPFSTLGGVSHTTILAGEGA